MTKANYHFKFYIADQKKTREGIVAHNLSERVSFKNAVKVAKAGQVVILVLGQLQYTMDASTLKNAFKHDRHKVELDVYTSMFNNLIDSLGGKDND